MSGLDKIIPLLAIGSIATFGAILVKISNLSLRAAANENIGMVGDAIAVLVLLAVVFAIGQAVTP